LVEGEVAVDPEARRAAIAQAQRHRLRGGTSDPAHQVRRGALRRAEVGAELELAPSGGVGHGAPANAVLFALVLGGEVDTVFRALRGGDGGRAGVIKGPDAAPMRHHTELLPKGSSGGSVA